MKLRSSNLCLPAFIWIIFLISPACVSTKNWPSDQQLLHKQEIKGNAQISSEDLSSLYRQKPNRKIFGLLPYVWIYNFGEKVFKPEKVQQKIEKKENYYKRKIRKASDAQKNQRVNRLIKRRNRKLKRLNRKYDEGNWFMRSVGEPPVFLDTAEANNTAAQMEQYLKSKGYFQGKVNISYKDVLKRRRKVIYTIQEGAATYLGKITYLSSNPDIDSILQKNVSEQLIKEGDNYDVRKISSERLRIEQLLRNNGFLYFSRQYVVFKVDSLHFNQKVGESSPELISEDSSQLEKKTLQRIAPVTVIINNPSEGPHKAYKIEKVFFHVVEINDQQQKEDPKTLVSPDTKINYIYDGRRLNYSYKILDRRIRLKSGQRYSLRKITETQRSLGILDMFKFVNINPDTSQGNLNLQIYTTPLDKFQITDEVGFNVIQGLPGPFVNVSLKTRNIFGGAEIFENSLRLAIDGQTSFSESDNFYSSQEIGFNSSLTFPKILFPISKNLRYRLNQFNPTTKLNLGFNFVKRPEYTRTTLAASISYKGQLGFSTYQFTLADLNLVNTRSISDEFRTQLVELSNQSILESFDRALVSSTYLIYTYNNNRGDERQKSQFIKFLIEGGGLSLSLLRGTSLIEENRIFGLRVFQFWRFNPTYNYYLPLGKKFHNLVFRVNLGVVRPFGRSATLPYEKFFFAGGSSSIRAWQPRRLGPGSYQPPVNEDGTFDFSIEQPGEILLEGNIEYRFPIFGYIRGALFLDAGNVWTFGEDSERPGGQFKFNSFLNEIALGSGFGIRLNLPFLLLRFDLGLKVYDPARRSDRRWVIRQFNPLKPFEQDFLLLNIGIGYPF